MHAPSEPSDRFHLLVRYGTAAWHQHEPTGYPSKRGAAQALAGIVRDRDPDFNEERVSSFLGDGLVHVLLPHGRALRAIVASIGRVLPPALEPVRLERHCPRSCDADHPPMAHYLGHDLVGAKLAKALEVVGADTQDMAALYRSGQLGHLHTVGAAALERVGRVLADGRHHPAEPGADWARRVDALGADLEYGAPQPLRDTGALGEVRGLLEEAARLLRRADHADAGPTEKTKESI